MHLFRIIASGFFVLALPLVACTDGGDVDVLTYEEFKARAYQEPETGLFIVNGDEPVENEQQLRALYEAYRASATRVGDGQYGTTEQALVINRTENYEDDRWSANSAMNLRYCISQVSFGSSYFEVVSAMNQAAAAWESVATVNFIHDSSKDGACDQFTTGVTFDVRRDSMQPYFARAFFPSSPRVDRNILIDDKAFGVAPPLTLTGILRHELGHALGFRHEHIRPENGTCPEAGSWRTLTPYDRASVMHYRYPECQGEYGDFTLSALDRAGVDQIYPRADIKLIASYVPYQGGARRTFTSTSSTPRSFTLYYDEAAGNFEQQPGGPCNTGQNNPTYLKLTFQMPTITDCSFRGSWDSAPTLCTAEHVSFINSRGTMLLNTDRYAIDPSTCQPFSPLRSVLPSNTLAWFKVNVKINGTTYTRVINYMKQ